MTPDPLVASLRQAAQAVPGSKIGQIFEYGRDKPGLIPMWFGESDVPTPDFIKRAAEDALAQGLTKYSDKRGVTPLRDALSEYLSGLYGVTIGEDRIRAAASGMSAIMIALQMLVEPGKNVVFITPLWPNASAATRTLGGEVREVQLDVNQHHEHVLDLDKLFAAFDDNTVALFVASPSNPTGWTLREPKMRAILEECRRRGIWVIADEVYARLCYDRHVAPSFLEIADPEDRVIAINSFSKTWCMTGWRLGWAVVPASIGRVFEKVTEFNTSGATTFVQWAGVAAVKGGEPFLEEQKRICQANRDRIQARLGQLPRVRLAKAPASFYAWFSVEGEPDSMALAKRLVDEAGVGLAPGAAFGAGGEGHLRLCFASAPDTVERALDRLIPALR
ncbi:MAG: pyridoxal phosphate-dependent aminotransferase [Alphaproteobacteria bacterium]|nr:pyridoxal phosphate-dependent aminotransferase [Alphaproteobacteria bacterium]